MPTRKPKSSIPESEPVAAPAPTPAAAPVVAAPVAATPVAAPVAPAPRKTSIIVPIIMIPLMILLGWFIFTNISTFIDTTPTKITGTPALSNIDQCYLDAYNAMIDNWLGYCRVNNIKIYKDSKGNDTCNTPATYSDQANAVYLANKALCLARYK